MATLGLFTPYSLEPGGGERYLLSIAEAFRGELDVSLITPEPQSPERLKELARALDLNVDHVAAMTLRDAGARPPFDLAIVMANEALPPVPGLGRKNYYLCQFPFPCDPSELIRRARFWPDYEGVVVYSNYAKRHLTDAVQAISAPKKPIRVIHPPVAEVKSATGPESRIAGTILSVGRFFSEAHSKRQDELIAAIRDLQPAEFVLHLAGAVHDNENSRRHFDLCRSLAGGLPIEFHPNAARTELGRLYAQSACYWHGAGLGADPETQPEKFEHFGITVVEAMASGCVPFVLNQGGPASIVTSGRDGWVYRTPSELVEMTSRFLKSTSPGIVLEMRTAARRTAHQYRFDVFSDNWKELLG